MPSDARTQAIAIFDAVWQRLEQERGARELRLPKEIIWLGGAPGAGKGTNTTTILKLRGIKSAPIVMSSLLDTPEMRAIKDSGALVGDADVVRALLQALLEPRYRRGAMVDGFPRTAVQVECIRLLQEKMAAQHAADRRRFPAPVHRACILHVSREVAIARQLSRGRKVLEHNARVRSTGVGELQEERATDLSAEHVAKRYDVFCEQSLKALESMRDGFHFHFIDANGTIPEVEANIVREFGG
jgi:adenylate kinase